MSDEKKTDKLEEVKQEILKQKKSAVKYVVQYAYFPVHIDITPLGIRSALSMQADEFTQLELVPEISCLKITKLDRSGDGKSIVVYVPLANVRNLVMA